MLLGIGEGGDAAIGRRLAWLSALRIVVLTLVLVVTVTVYVRNLSGASPAFRVALAVVGGGYVLAASYAVFLRLGRALRGLALAQLVTDQLVYTAIVYLSGGAASGAASLYALACVAGAVAIGTRGVLVSALAGAGFYCALAITLAFRWVSPPSDSPAAYAIEWREVSFPVIVNLVGLAVVSALASSLAERVRLTGGKLEAVASIAAEAQTRAVQAEGRATQAEDRAERAEDRAEKAERLAALGRLAAGLAHEIRNPLSSIAGSIELLRTGGSLAPEDQKLCEIIQRETSRLNDIVSDMLELSRRREPTRTRFDLAAAVRDLATLASRSGRGVDVRVRCDVPDEVPVEADPDLMRQVVWNLLRNAVQASSAGDEVLVRVTASGDEATLSFVDRGPGIAPDARERLFDAFFTTRSHGIGIGLAVVKQIVDDHRFSLDVESRENQGTTFSVRLPLAAGERDGCGPAVELSTGGLSRGASIGES